MGLPLALRFAQSGANVIGIDVDPKKIRLLLEGQTYIKHISAETIRQALVKNFRPASEIEAIREVAAIIICVPTPLTKTREPDLSYVLNTGRLIAPHLQKGVLVVLESTTYPGTTDQELREVLEDGSGMRAGQDFFLAFSPEREDPGNARSNVNDIPKVVGGYTPECCARAVSLYAKAIKTIVPVSSCKTAEATKLLENIFRSVNIALVNELKVIYDAMGIDIWEVIEAARTKPFGFMPFYPGPGLGGHCIPIDPFYLAWKAREFGKHTRFIELAGEINTSMPEYVVHKLVVALNLVRKPVNGSRILLVGLAYKANVDDMRESPTFVLLDLLQAQGASVSYYDPQIPVVGPTREHSRWEGLRSIEWNKASIESFDAAVIVTAHREVNYDQLLEWSSCIVDTRNVFPASQATFGKVFKA